MELRINRVRIKRSRPVTLMSKIQWVADQFSSVNVSRCSGFLLIQSGTPLGVFYLYSLDLAADARCVHSLTGAGLESALNFTYANRPELRNYMFQFFDYSMISILNQCYVYLFSFLILVQIIYWD